MRSYLVNGVLVLVTVLMTCAAVEVVFALFLPQQAIYTSTEHAFFIKYDSKIGWLNLEGSEGVYRPAPDIPPTTVRINALGYRGKEVAQKKAEGKKRVIVLGDSNTFGYGIEEGARFTDIMADKLPPNTEIINFGVFGYGTDQEAMLLEKEGVRYHAETVLLVVSAGDLSDNISSINGGNAKPFFRFDDDVLSLHNTPVPVAVPHLRNRWARSDSASFFYRHSHLFRFIMKRATPVSRYMVNTVPEMSEAQGMKVTKALIQAINDLCVTNRSRFGVVLIPHGEWLEGARRMPGRAIGYYAPLAAALDENGIPYIDTTSALIRVDNEKNPVFFIKDPVHLTPVGNQVVAQVVSGFLTDRKLMAK